MSRGAAGACGGAAVAVGAAAAAPARAWRAWGTRRWLAWHGHHGQVLMRYTNAEAVRVQALASGTVVAIRLGGIPGQLAEDGVLELGAVPLVPLYVCPCGKKRRA